MSSGALSHPEFSLFMLPECSGLDFQTVSARSGKAGLLPCCCPSGWPSAFTAGCDVSVGTWHTAACIMLGGCLPCAI